MIGLDVGELESFTGFVVHESLTYQMGHTILGQCGDLWELLDYKVVCVRSLLAAYDYFLRRSCMFKIC